VKGKTSWQDWGSLRFLFPTAYSEPNRITLSDWRRPKGSSARKDIPTVSPRNHEEVVMNTLAEKTKVEIFEIEHLGETIIVIPTEELGEFDFERIEAAARVVLQLLESPAVQNVVMDFHKIDYYGSPALAFFVRLWKRVRKHRGRMALCNLSDHGMETLRITKLDQFWPVYPSKEEAVIAVERWLGHDGEGHESVDR
jgi:anti-anti-sigma factor